MAKTTRVSKKVISGITAERFNEAVSEYALSDAMVCKICAKMDAEMTKVREKYADELGALNKVLIAELEVMEIYCMENKEVLFKEKRSMETVHGKIGFRMGTPKLKTLPKYTWDRVLEKMESLMPDFIRVKKEVNKDALLDQRADESVAPFLNQIGVYVDQDENFFFEPKKEEVAA